MNEQLREIQDGILVVSGDTHTNSEGGLMPPQVTLLNGNTLTANPVQKLLYRGWTASWDAVNALKVKYGLPVIFIANGDSVDRNKHNSWTLHTKNPTEILNMAVKALAPALDVADSYAFTKGTEAHTGKKSWLEDELAKDLGCPEHEGGYAYYHLLLEVGGQTFDIQHHVESNSIRPWTKGAGAMRSAKIVMDYYYDSGDCPPNWALRNHVHHFEDSGTNHRTRTLFLPAWEAPGPFIHRIGFGAKMPEFGLAYFVCKGGQVIEWDVLTVEVKRSPPTRMVMMS